MDADPTTADPALATACPRCGAAPGEPCRTAERVIRDPHSRRRSASADSAERVPVE